MKRKAIVIGVNHYKDAMIANLRYAVSDASRLSGLLEHLPGGHGFESRFMADPTDGDVTEALESELSCLSEGDLFFFFFAGHGIEQQGTNQHLLLCHNAHKRILQTETTRRSGTPRRFGGRFFEMGNGEAICYAGLEPAPSIYPITKSVADGR